jgi:squalene-hopene/tetraprenyl-beta-curcumene cyclase
LDPTDLESTLTNARNALLAERAATGHWVGELSSSALSTATAVVALHLVDPESHDGEISRGSLWLMAHQNRDGGWGDTPDSLSNLSTTLLAWAALERVRPGSQAAARARDWVDRHAGDLDPYFVAQAVEARYGKDRTFAVPILMTCALCGLFGPPAEGWKRVRALPLELAAFPRSWFAALRMPVVSYALPALIAIGHARNRRRGSGVAGWARRLVWPRVSRLLADLQPSGGGFLEATPLTAFVTMALVDAGETGHPVVGRAVRFLRQSARPDGSWPIDTNLATWTTTLAVKALGHASEFKRADRRRVRIWLLEQQYRTPHPYTGAAPGGWAWTNLSGGVPDGDDTPGALLALKILTGESTDEDSLAAAEAGCGWLLDLQNRDGGMPTFCRGWGALPFDRSSPDLTAHALKAWDAWKDDVSGLVRARMDRAMESAVAYLSRTQGDDGSWLPLWFGNQLAPDEGNRTYGTATVLSSLNRIDPWALRRTEPLRAGAADWLLRAQNADGGWGGGPGLPSSIEETGLAVEALAGVAREQPAVRSRVLRGAEFLAAATRGGTEFPARPIGFYFAKLWYAEKLYPMVWAVGGLEAALRGEQSG